MFRAGATGAQPLRYQWWKDGAPILQTNRPTFVLTGVTTNDAGNYAVVSNGVVTAIRILDAGSGYSSQVVVVIAPPLRMCQTSAAAAMSWPTALVGRLRLSGRRECDSG